MPEVGKGKKKRKFPYTREGMAAADEYAEKIGVKKNKKKNKKKKSSKTKSRYA